MWPLTQLEKARTNAPAYAARHTTSQHLGPQGARGVDQAYAAPPLATGSFDFVFLSLLPSLWETRAEEALQLLRHLRPPFPPTVLHQTSWLRQIPATCLVRIDARLLI